MIISISGLIGSGKDTIADYLIANYDFARESWAGTLKDAVSSVFGWDRELLEGKTEESRAWREQIDTWWAVKLDIPHLTPRWILQQWGTEVCRRGFHDSIWVASLENKLRKNTKNVVITDTRFSNELNAIKRIGGITLRVTRGQDPEWIEIAKNSPELMKQLYPHVHASEYSSVNLEYDCYVDNNGTIDDLHDTISSLLLDLRFSKSNSFS